MDDAYWIKMNEKMGNELFKKVKTMGRRDIIAFIADKYKDRILDNNFLQKNIDYEYVSRDFGIFNQQLYTWFTFKLRINKLCKSQNQWEYYPTGDSKKEKLQLELKQEKDLKTNAYFYVYEVWQLLALYARYLAHSDVKKVFRQLENAFYQKNYKRVKEIFTPLIYYEDVGLKMIFCKVVRRKNKGVYEGILLEENMKNTETKKRLLNTRCLVFVEDINKRNEINKKMTTKQGCKVTGFKPVPHRSLTNQIIKIE